MAKVVVPPNSIHLETIEDLRAWLVVHHLQQDDVWLVLWKKQSGRPRLDYDKLVEESLCFGWIDSKPNKLDDNRSMLWLAPRKAGTNWSKLNRQRAEQAIKTGRMMAAGLAKISAAKNDGSWNALD